MSDRPRSLKPSCVGAETQQGEGGPMRGQLTTEPSHAYEQCESRVSSQAPIVKKAPTNVNPTVHAARKNCHTHLSVLRLARTQLVLGILELVHDGPFSTDHMRYSNSSDQEPNTSQRVCACCSTWPAKLSSWLRPTKASDQLLIDTNSALLSNKNDSWYVPQVAVPCSCISSGMRKRTSSSSYHFLDPHL